MATEVLRPQDWLVQRIRDPPASFSRRKANYGYPNSSCNYNYNYSSNSRSSRKSVVRPEKQDQKKRFGANQPEQSISKRSSSDDLKTMKMEKVTILRRGESLDSKIKSEPLKKEAGGLVVTGTQRLGPDPKMVPKRVGIVDLKAPVVAGKSDLMYAGSAFAMSPAPSSLPLPSFSKKLVSVAVDDSATRDLRRLLRLE